MTVKKSQSDPRLFECVEIYVPKKLEHLSELYNYLRMKLVERRMGAEQAVPIDGFSMYEVDGAFYGEQIHEERTIVIRILYNRAGEEDDASIRNKISLLGSEIAADLLESGRFPAPGQDWPAIPWPAL